MGSLYIYICVYVVGGVFDLLLYKRPLIFCCIEHCIYFSSIGRGDSSGGIGAATVALASVLLHWLHCYRVLPAFRARLHFYTYTYMGVHIKCHTVRLCFDCLPPLCLLSLLPNPLTRRRHIGTYSNIQISRQLAK